MTINARKSDAIATGAVTLADVELAVRTNRALKDKQRRDYRSGVVAIGKALCQPLSAILLDLAAIQKSLDQLNPAALGISPKTMANLRYNFIRAVDASGLKTVHIGGRKTPALNSDWQAFRDRLPDVRADLGLSALMHYCSRNCIPPRAVTDATISHFIDNLRRTSLRRRPEMLHRRTTRIWNETVALFPDLGLREVDVPSLWTRHRRLDWSAFPATFLEDVDQCQAWYGRANRYARHARKTALAPSTLRTQRGYILSMATSAIECGIPARSIKDLESLVRPEILEQILPWRDNAVGGVEVENAYNYHAAQCLYRVAKEYIRPAPKIMEEIRELTSSVPRPRGGMTEKNRTILRQFNDPTVLRRLYALPGHLFSEVRRQAHPNGHTLTHVHVALAVAILSYVPIRLENLLALEFDKHLLIAGKPGQKSYVCLPAKEVKNNYDIQIQIPDHLAKLLLEYRNEIAPKLFGYRTKALFLGPGGSIRWERGLGDLITAYLWRHAGIRMTPHVFRHLAGEIILRTFPDGHVIVKDLLGHKSISTTLRYYVHMDSRRAGLQHQKAIFEALPRDLQRSIGDFNLKGRRR